jgi:hypothetical protein
MLPVRFSLLRFLREYKRGEILLRGSPLFSFPLLTFADFTTADRTARRSRFFLPLHVCGTSPALFGFQYATAIFGCLTSHTH